MCGSQDLCPLGLSEGPLSTCRFDTRIDYVYVRGGGVSVDRLVHADTDASDHNLVCADLNLDGAMKGERGGGGGQEEKRSNEALLKINHNLR